MRTLNNLALFASLLVAACGGTAEHEPISTYCPVQTLTQNDGSLTQTAPRAPDQTCDRCFDAGNGLGQCSGDRALWVGCAYEPPAAGCAPSGFDGQYCCDPSPKNSQ